MRCARCCVTERSRSGQGADVVVVPTAAAFIGLTEAAILTSVPFDDFDVHVEALMVSRARRDGPIRISIERLAERRRGRTVRRITTARHVRCGARTPSATPSTPAPLLVAIGRSPRCSVT